ncbi:MAG: S1 RNA-binding domain-containing protein, partial [Muribaculaceae bacterium]|nr:S1 RNA-binding domain-containing protein [Muribaculaceae bacterium]
DMMVHRLLERYLGGARSVNVDKLEEQCKHSSEMEQLAANAERASIKYKQVEYMNDHLGEVYNGIITGVTEWGLYVELEDNKCEGLVPVRDLADDYYDFDEKNYTLIGRRHGNRYRLGDQVKVQVARAALDKKQLDFVIVDEKNPARTMRTLAEANAETERRLAQNHTSATNDRRNKNTGRQRKQPKRFR